MRGVHGTTPSLRSIGCGDAARLRGSLEVLCELTAVLVRTWVYCTTAYRKCVFGTVTLLTENLGPNFGPPGATVPIAAGDNLALRSGRSWPCPLRFSNVQQSDAVCPHVPARRHRYRAAGMRGCACANTTASSTSASGRAARKSQLACCWTNAGINIGHGVDHDGDAGGEVGGLAGCLQAARQRRRSSDDGGSSRHIGDRDRREVQDSGIQLGMV